MLLMIRKYVFALACALAGLVLAGPAAAGEPSKAGLQLWLDASDGQTIERGAGGVVTKWRDKSGHGRDAVNTGAASKPQLAQNAMGEGRNAIRLGGKGDGFLVPGVIRARAGSVTVFAVSQRLAGQVQAGNKWQRLVSSSDGSKLMDNKLPNFCLTGPKDGEAKAYPPTIEDYEESGAVIGTLGIGRRADAAGAFFSGDIAEVLVYDRTFLSEDEVQLVLQYLKEKWGARIAREERGWTRIGELPNPPRRVSDALPLSDQANKGGWVKDETFSDEFEGGQLDPQKWMPKFTDWKGRQPAWFNPENVSVSRGQLHLVMRRQEAPAPLRKLGFTSYTSAAMQSLTKTGYGYYEVKARPMNSGGSSSFWFSGTDLPDHGTEIDVFEIGGKAAGFERKYNMNVHVFKTPQEKRHWNVGGVWLAPWRLADGWHVYGLERDAGEIQYYVDGVLVRRMKNTDWLYPMYLRFDSETMPTWFGMPKDEDLPSTYSVEYVRTWRKGAK
jgi:hypothetical protein